MKYIPYFFLFALLMTLGSCGASKKSLPQQVVVETLPEKTVKADKLFEAETESPNLAWEISENAKAFLGTRYKYGGTTKEGMDCSGLVYTAFLEEEINLPRIAREMSLLGTRLFLREVSIGDLLFFETDKNKKVINHVGLVVETIEEEIFFIHSSTSKGVIISSLKESYWQDHFVMARRLL